MASSNEKTSSDKVVADKVKRAMYSMQRAVWEQGVAMQALLELGGEEEMVILMAKEAVSCQIKDRRMAMLGDSSALSDAVSPGEVVPLVAKRQAMLF